MSYTGDWNYNTAVKVTDMSLEEKLSASDLDWKIKSTPVTYGDFGEYTADNRFAVYRGDTNELLDIYGSNRQVRSNASIVKLFDEMFSLGNFQMSELGQFGNGGFIYASADLPEDYDINVKQIGDIIKPRLVLVDSHLNNEGLKVIVHFNRLICTNGMSTKVSQKVGVISHAGGINRDVAKRVLTAAVNSVKTKTQVSEFLAEQQIKIVDAQMQLVSAFGEPDKPLHEQSPTIKTILELFQGNAVGGELLSAYNTAYGLLQSVTEFYSHHSNVKNENNRFQSILSGEYAKNATQFERQLVRTYQ